MLVDDLNFSLFDFTLSLSAAIDAVSPAIADHQRRVAYIAWSIGKELGLNTEQRGKLFFAGLLHDVGSISLKERLSIIHCDEDASFNNHAELGYLLLRDFGPLSDVATIIRYHHVQWGNGEGGLVDGQTVPIESMILHLADRISVLIDYDQEVLGQAKSIVEKIRDLSGEAFVPECIDAFAEVSRKEFFWLDTSSPNLGLELWRIHDLPFASLDLESLQELTRILSRIIDFRSRFTATHSSGVSATSVALAGLAGFSKKECAMMRVAGDLHDLGKLAVPKEILEKPDKLSMEEFNIVRSHTYYTYSILSHVRDFKTINQWASFHHERLDGSGYPFHLGESDLPLGSRIMAVSDVFTAVSEDRPYREGMSVEKTLSVLSSMAKSHSLDPDVVSLVEGNIQLVNDVRRSAQVGALKQYETFSKLGLLY
jgi:HD-GYP domain-containing protein (c-di-GMP phosphodiesterase class II)